MHFLLIPLLSATLFLSGCALPFDPYIVDKGISVEKQAELETRIAELQTRIDAATEAAAKAELLNEQGVLYREMGNLRNAKNSYEAALALAPNWYLAQHNLATIFEEVGDKEQSIIEYQKMYASTTELSVRAQAIDRIVLLYRQLNDPDSAEKALDTFAADHADTAKDMILSLRNDIARTRTELTPAQ